MKTFLYILGGFLAFVVLGSLAEGASAGEAGGLVAAAMFVVIPVGILGAAFFALRWVKRDIFD